jgi:hypothetical protein
MSEEKSSKQEKIHIDKQQDINKGHDNKRSYEDQSYGRGEIKEGYQPITDVTSDPPRGGSGVPDKTED